jgi:hypothetical protein
MIDKLIWAVIPACITFGPLFMTRIVGTAAPQNGNRLLTGGVLMLSIGLIGIFRIISKQQKVIRTMQARLGKEA